ncbi:DivIVA domain-containing protein [Rhodococcus sp. CH91]|uniref:DivIVA domain-containing protein n=1 Tax=Rhodococcus sp. CH91 TaxID=2910256 RepID=UPI001F4A1DA1|nr:DivIVA domain-containing protein [Rhodococcus sp. CH91]
MLTVLLYVLVMAAVAAVLFFVASAVFGRGETLAPLPPGTTVTVLPASDVTGTDIRDLRFQQTWRGYKMSEVDWALDRLAREVDDLRGRLAEAEAQATGEPAAARAAGDPAGAHPAGEPPTERFETRDVPGPASADPSGTGGEPR